MSAHYRVLVRTRAWNTDYNWIGARPRSEWWRSADYGSLLTNRTALAKSLAPSGQQLVLTGIAGNRHDSHGTIIRYDLAIEPDPSGALTDDDVAALIGQYWDSRNNSQLGQVFDQALSPQANQLVESNSPEVLTAVTQAIQSLPRLTGLPPAPQASLNWIGAQHPAALATMVTAPEVVHSTLLNGDIRDDLLRQGSSPLLVVEGETGSGTIVPKTPSNATPSKALHPAATTSRALTTTGGGGGCLITFVGGLAIFTIALNTRHPARSEA